MVGEAVVAAVEASADVSVQEPIQHQGATVVSTRSSPQPPTGRLVVITIDIFR